MVRIVILIGLFAFGITTLYAAGYAVSEQSTRSLGLGGAMTAVVDDISSIYFNPSNLSFLESGHYFKASGILKSENRSYQRAADNLTLGEYPSVKNEDRTRFYPFIGVGKKNRDTADFYGIALYQPFAIHSIWSATGPQRYQVNERILSPYFVTPSYSKRVNDDFSVGLGFNMVFADYQYYRSLPLGNTLFSQSGNSGFFENPQYDSMAKIQMDAPFSLSANLGFTYTVSENSRVAVSYRSQTNLTFKGDYSVASINQGLPNLGASYHSDVSSNFTLPQSFSLGYVYKPSQKRLFTLDIQWMDWSVEDERVYDLKDEYASFIDEVEKRDWKDSWSLRGGYEWPLSWENIYARVGGFYEHSPVNEDYMEPSSSPNNSFGLGFGLSWRNSENQFDVGYQHVFSSPRDSERSLHAQTGAGRYNSSTDILGLSYLRYF